MEHLEHHVMHAALGESAGTMRYSCPTCHRCVEDGPDGLRILVKGNQSAVHRAGALMVAPSEIEPPGAAADRVLH